MARIARFPRPADLVPRAVRSWPWIRQWFRQEWEIARAWGRAQELATLLEEEEED